MACPGSCIWRGHAGETGSFTVSTVGSRYYGAPDGFPFGAGSAGQRFEFFRREIVSDCLVGAERHPHLRRENLHCAGEGWRQNPDDRKRATIDLNLRAERRGVAVVLGPVRVTH